MKLLAAPFAAALLLASAPPAAAQSTTRTQVRNDTDVKDGVVTHTRKTVRETKRKTGRPKKILGVKVGHKTAKTKVVRTTKTSSDGDASTTVKVTH